MAGWAQNTSHITIVGAKAKAKAVLKKGGVAMTYPHRVDAVRLLHNQVDFVLELLTHALECFRIDDEFAECLEGGLRNQYT